MFGLLVTAPALLFDAPLPLVAPAPAAIVQYRAAVATTAPERSNLFPPTTVLLASNMIGATDRGDVYQGGVNNLDLASLLDEVPLDDLDMKGEDGIKADQQGIQRLKERQAKEEEAAKLKYMETIELEQMHEQLKGTVK